MPYISCELKRLELGRLKSFFHQRQLLLKIIVTQTGVSNGTLAIRASSCQCP